MNVLKWSPGVTNTVDQTQEQSGPAELLVLQEELRAARDEQRSAVGILRDILYGADVATFLLDAAMRIEFFTPAAETLFRVLSSDVKRPFVDLVMVAGDDTLEADMREVASGRSGERLALVTMYGKSYQRRISPRQACRNGLSGVVVSYADVTAARHAQEEALASYEQVRSVVMMLPSPAAIVDDSGKVVHANPRFEAVLKSHPDLLRRAINHWRAVPDAHGPLTFAVEGLGRVQLSIAAVGAMATNPMHVVTVEAPATAAPGQQSFVTDIEHLNQLRHEVIQPLQTLRMLHGIMLKRQADADDFAARHRLEETYEALSGMLNSLFLQQELINGLLVASPDKEIALSGIVDSLKAELGYHAAAKSLEWHVAPCSFRVTTEPRLLECLIRGLMLRVVRIIDQGRLVVDFHAIGGQVVMAFRQQCDGDTPLMESSAAIARNEKVNELLFPAALIAQLAESLGVAVTVGAETPADPLCMVSIPIAAAATMGQAGALAKDGAWDQEGAGQPDDEGVPDAVVGRTICVVDDDANLLQSVASALDASGFNAVTFGDVDSFFAARAALDVGCVVVDAIMPDKDGFALIERLCREDNPPPIIMVTGAGDVKLAVKAMKSGAADFIEKPVDPDQLAAAVARLCLEADDESASRPAEPPAPPLRAANLTDRQAQVLELVVEGHANKEIAARLNISQRTVENHRAAVMRRTGARTLPELIRMQLTMQGPTLRAVGSGPD